MMVITAWMLGEMPYYERNFVLLILALWSTQDHSVGMKKKKPEHGFCWQRQPDGRMALVVYDEAKMNIWTKWYLKRRAVKDKKNHLAEIAYAYKLKAQFPEKWKAAGKENWEHDEATCPSCIRLKEWLR